VIIVKPAREQVCDARKRNTIRRQSLTRPVRASRAARAVMIKSNQIKSNRIEPNARVERDIIIIIESEIDLLRTIGRSPDRRTLRRLGDVSVVLRHRVVRRRRRRLASSSRVFVASTSTRFYPRVFFSSDRIGTFIDRCVRRVKIPIDLNVSIAVSHRWFFLCFFSTVRSTVRTDRIGSNGIVRIDRSFVSIVCIDRLYRSIVRIDRSYSILLFEGGIQINDGS